MAQTRSQFSFIERTLIPSRARIVEVIGAIAVIIGAYLPWIQVDPTLPDGASIPLIGYPYMDVGLQGMDFAVVGAAVIILVPLIFIKRTWVHSLISSFTGVGISTICIDYYINIFEYTNFFVPDTGWYVSLAGGLVLIIAGIARLRS